MLCSPVRLRQVVIKRKMETRMTVSVVEQDPNTRNVKKKDIYDIFFFTYVNSIVLKIVFFSIVYVLGSSSN